MQTKLTFCTPGRGFTDITTDIAEAVSRSSIDTGICHLFLQHTSASLILCENADPQVRKDLEMFMMRFIPDGDPLFKHVEEGKDDMPAHVRTVLTQSCLVIPITAKRLALGTWQGLYLWEHRLASHQRHLVVTVLGA